MRTYATEFGQVNVEELAPQVETITPEKSLEWVKEEEYYYGYDNWRDMEDGCKKLDEMMDENPGAYLDCSPDPDV